MKSSPFANWLAALALVLTAALDYYVLARGLPPGADSVLVGTIVGAWNAASGMVLSYFFGSSASHDKTAGAPDVAATTATDTPTTP